MNNSTWFPEIGDKVKFTDTFTAIGIFRGEIAEVIDSTINSNIVTVRIKNGEEVRVNIHWMKPVTQDDKITQCECDIMTLMRVGCECGGQ